MMITHVPFVEKHHYYGKNNTLNIVKYPLHDGNFNTEVLFYYYIFIIHTFGDI